MLLVWLFALGSVVVNACVGADASRHQVQSVAASQMAVDAEAAQPDVTGCTLHAPEGAASACLKFCADESTGVSVVKPASSAETAVALALWPTLALVLQTSLVAASPAGDDFTRLPPAIPLPIVFLRLTI